MNDEKWQQVTETVMNAFPGASRRTEPILADGPDGAQARGSREILEFDHPSGSRYRLVRENHPVVLGKKQHFSHRAGDTARTEYQLSDSETTNRLRIYQEIGFDDWQEVTLDKLGL